MTKPENSSSVSVADAGEAKWPCMVCGRPTEPCCPLTICERCKDSPQAEVVRLNHRVWFWKERANHLSDTLDATEIYASTASSRDDFPEPIAEKVKDSGRTTRTMLKEMGFIETSPHIWEDPATASSRTEEGATTGPKASTA